MAADLGTNQARFIDLIKTLEPVFIKAGKRASLLQNTALVNKKLDTGTYEIDVVTNADIEVQEMVLSELCRTELRECRLVAEEKTDFADKFNPDGELLLAIDPIDGTYRYAAGKPIYSLIVSLQAPCLPLYTFAYYPAIDWAHRFVNNTHEEIGKRPALQLFADRRKAIAYSYGDPNKALPESMKEEAKKNGYVFIDKKELTLDCGAGTMLLAGVVNGYYCENPPAVDGLVGMHYALAHNYKIY
ncbi:TPA: hypothetical protein HA310_02865, partial [Candidatus Micrarchaeota archaeon]|nr:hypothetical protein [Candidatus Micrarchaeota archaeon]